jgi:hypothetical protein
MADAIGTNAQRFPCVMRRFDEAVRQSSLQKKQGHVRL